ncbi:hypothetical protein [Levilactobacillus suantsaiihabitans]|uniref:Uncharacterized protein n=1 Tax=Levilactobacillus suantsaiihabitans TaxID=2487722 RepID=A0A4Z0J6Z5_9LACO|nr:hypothetical protein [Levilactobacillus suantsaiihabitans]TGD17552.1 hypothetical protein EGT51_11840 [Levilactobacillus suantsaiihabitans]
MKKKDIIALAIAAVIVVFGGVMFVKTQVAVSENHLAANITKAVQNKDGDLFLKQFSKDQQDIKFSEIGAKSVVTDMHNNSTDSISEIGKIIVDGRHVAGTKVTYHFNVESKKVLGLFNSYYLTTRKSPVKLYNYTGYGDSMQVKITDGKDQTITKRELSSGLFPGKYNLDVSTGDYEGAYWVHGSGDGDTIDLEITSDDY